jgi:hypothetical protein
VEVHLRTKKKFNSKLGWNWFVIDFSLDSRLWYNLKEIEDFLIRALGSEIPLSVLKAVKYFPSKINKWRSTSNVAIVTKFQLKFQFLPTMSATFYTAVLLKVTE